MTELRSGPLLYASNASRRCTRLHFVVNTGNLVVCAAAAGRSTASKNRRQSAAPGAEPRRWIRTGGTGVARTDEEMLRRRRRLARSRLWPACLCSTDVRDELDTYTAAAPITPTPDDDANMAAMTSPDVDVDDGLYTIYLSGGAPFGFRLGDDEGRLVVSKVCICAIASFFHFFATAVIGRSNYNIIHFTYWTLRLRDISPHITYPSLKSYTGLS